MEPMQCPYCLAVFFAASAWSGPPPEEEPGILCPECGEFVSDDEILDPEAQESDETPVYPPDNLID